MTIDFADDLNGGTTSMVTGDCSSLMVLGTVSETFSQHVTSFYSRYGTKVPYIMGLGVEFLTDDPAYCSPNDSGAGVGIVDENSPLAPWSDNSCYSVWPTLIEQLS